MERERLSGARRRLASLCAAALLTVALAAASMASGTGAAQLPRCVTSSLRLSLAQPSAGAGRDFWAMALRNAGSRTCALRGYPGVALLSKSGKPIKVSVQRETGAPVRTVTLAPGKRAYFTFAYESSGPCIPHFFTAYGLQVYPPGSFTRLTLHTRRIEVCSPSVGGHPSVSPVRATLEIEP